MTLLAGITLATALLGAVLGVLTTWRMIDRDRVKVVVRSSWLISVDPITQEGIRRVGVSVTNLSTFPITISQVAFRLRRPRGYNLTFMPTLLNGGTLPNRIEPRSRITVAAPLGFENQPEFPEITHAVVHTECLRRFQTRSRFSHQDAPRKATQSA